MSKRPEIGHSLTPDQVKGLVKLGFTAATIVNRDISVLIPGTVVGAFRSFGDAKKFATSMNKLYGCKDGYRGVQL